MDKMMVRFEGISEERFYKVINALALVRKGGGIGKVVFEEEKRRDFTSSKFGSVVEGNVWNGEIHFLTEEAMESFGKKIQRRFR